MMIRSGCGAAIVPQEIFKTFFFFTIKIFKNFAKMSIKLINFNSENAKKNFARMFYFWKVA